MFRFETIVGIVIVLSGQFAFAGEESGRKCPDQYSTYKEDRAALRAFIDSRTTDDPKKKTLTDRVAESKKDYDACLALANGADDDNCADNKTKKAMEEKFDQARKAFHNACGPAGFQTSSAGNNIECTDAIKKCQVCGSKKTAEADENRGLCATSEGSYDDSSSGSSGDGIKINFDRISRQAEFCPSLSSKAQKDYEKKYDDSRKDVKDLEKKLPEMQKKYTEAINKGEDEAAQAGDKMVKAQQQLDQELGEAEERFRQAKKDIAAQIVQLQQQIAQVDDQTRQLVLAKTDAETQYNEAIRQIELNCYQSASNTIAKLQADRLSRPFNRGGFQSMMKQVGLSDRASWQREADKYYRYCINSTPTKASKKSAKASYDSALRKADAGLQKVNEQRLTLVQQQMNLKAGACNPNASSGPDLTGQTPDESESCQAAKKAVSDSQRAQRKYNSEANKAASDQMKAQRKAQNEAGAAQMEAANTSRQIQDEKQRMKNLRRAAEIADKASDDAPDPKAYDRVMEKYGEFETVGRKYVQCMNKAGKCQNDPNGICPKLDALFRSTGTPVVAERSDAALTPAADANRAAPAGRVERTDLDRPAGSGAR